MLHKNARKAVEHATAMGPENVFASLEQTPSGVLVTLLYSGPLAARKKLFVRFGERRGEHEWVNPRDVPMQAQDGEATATIECGDRTGLEGACFAFFAQPNGKESERVWDSAGRPMGYYVFDAKTGKVEAR